MNKMTETHCPFCQQPNGCQVDNPDGCWCFQRKVPGILQELVPVDHKRKHCICINCIALFNLDPVAFTAKYAQ